MKYLLSVWIFSNNIYCLSRLFSFTTDLLTIQDLCMHTPIGGMLGCKMCGRFCKAKKTTRVSAIKCAVYCSPVLPLGKKKKNSLLLINTGHLVVRLPTRQLSHPVLTDPTLLCIWCFLGMEEAMSFPRVRYGRYSSGPCVLFRLFSLLCLKYCQ